MPVNAQVNLNPLSAAGLFALAARDLLPPLDLNVAEYADAHRFLPGIGGGVGEKYRTSRTPYLAEPMGDLTSGEYLTVCLVGPGQVAKTVAAENWLLRSVGQDPANMLWYMQSEEALQSFVKDRINPMIDDHPEILKARLGLRAIDDSLGYKRFRGMSAQFLTASKGNLISKSAPRIVADEVDAFLKTLGDIKVLLDVRRQKFGTDSMLLAMSHPDMARGMRPDTDWGKGIMAIYADSTRCLYYWKCPQCGGRAAPHPLAKYVFSVEYQTEGTLDEVEASAYLQCPHNGCVIPDSARMQMNATGVWVGEGQSIDKQGNITGQRVKRTTAGYWITGPMSPFMLGGIGKLVRERVKAEREVEVSGDDNTLRQVIVKQWGYCYAKARSAGSVDAETLAERADKELRLGVVPEGVRFITVAVDCQISTFEYLARGWGPGGESWVIDWGRMLADPATSAADWDKLRAEVFSKRYPLADGSGRLMGIRGCCYDTGGRPGVTQQAYAAWTRWLKEKHVRNYGLVGGREAFSILGLKGAKSVDAPPLQITYPDTARKANKLAARGSVPIGMFNPNKFKDDLSGQLQKAEVGALYVHFPYEMRGTPTPGKVRGYPIEGPHTFFEQCVAEAPKPNGRWEKIDPNARNEGLDLLVMTHVDAFLHGLTRINWERPPAWAAPWEANTMVAPDPSKEPVAGDATTPKKKGVVTVTVDPSTKKTIASRLA